MVKFIFGRELVSEDELFNREVELDIVVKSCSLRQPLAVIGYRRIGKSSLLNIAKLRLEHNFIVAKFSVEGVSSLEDYAERLSKALILEAISKSLRLRIKEYVGVRIGRALNMFLGSIKELGVRLDNVEFYIKTHNDFIEGRIKPVEFIGEVLDLPQRVGEDLNKPVVVMIDEFQQVRMLKQPFPNILRLMRSRFQSHSRVNYIISGSEIGVMEGMLNKRDQPFYAFFRILRLEPFSRETSISFLRDGLKELGATCSESVLEHVYEITRGFPAWLNLAGIKLLEGSCSVESFLRDPTIKSVVNMDLSGLTRKELNVLKSIAKGSRTPSELKVSNVFRVLKALRRRGLIDKGDEGYFIVDPIIEYTLKHELLA